MLAEIAFRPAARERSPAEVLVVHARDGLGGAVVVATELAERLGAAWRPTLVCNARGLVYDHQARSGLPTVALSEAVAMPYKPDPTDGSRLRQLWKHYYLFRAAQAYLRRRRPTLIHAHDEVSALAWGLAARAYGVPLVWHLHQQLPPRYGDGLTIAQAAHIVVPAQTNRSRLPADTSVPVTLVYNGVDPAAFRTERRFDRTPVTIGFVGNLVKRKRPEWVVNAVAALHREGLDVRLVAAGRDDGGNADRLAALANEGGLGDRFSYLGYRSDIPALLRDIDILALPSERDKEAFPKVILEAMASGAPVVATRSAAIPEAVIEGVTGFMTDPDSEDEFLARLRELAASPELRRRFAAKGREVVQARFDIAASIPRLESVYREVISRSDRAVAA